MSVINKIELNTTKMPAAQTSRDIVVRGKVGAKFFIILTQAGTIKFYDWTTETFLNGHAPKNNLIVTMNSNYFKRGIVFPTGGGTGGTYVLKLITLEDTKITNGSSVISKNIEKQTSDTTITFKPASNVSSTKYATLPSVTAVGAGESAVSTEYSFSISTAETDAGGFGLRSIFLNSTPGIDELQKFLNTTSLVDFLFYYQTTKTITTNLAGDAVSSTEIILSDITDLGIGTRVYYHKGTTEPAETITITQIEIDSKVVTFDNPVAFEDGETITFRAYGSKNMYLALGISLDFSNISLGFDEGFEKGIVKTLRTDTGPGTQLNLNNTLGITGGNVISITGVGVNNSSNNSVTSVTPDPSGGDGDGSIVVQSAQTLSLGTKITFIGTYSSLSLSGNIKTTLFPDSNKEINLDLDQLLTTGSAS